MMDVIVAGDFNQPSINWQMYSTIPNHRASIEVAEDPLITIGENGLHQVVKELTGGNDILDTVFVNYEEIDGRGHPRH